MNDFPDITDTNEPEVPSPEGWPEPELCHDEY